MDTTPQTTEAMPHPHQMSDRVLIETPQQFGWAAAYALGGSGQTALTLAGSADAGYLRFSDIAGSPALKYEDEIAERILSMLVGWANANQRAHHPEFVLTVPPRRGDVVTTLRVGIVLLDTPRRQIEALSMVVSDLNHRDHICWVDEGIRSYAWYYLQGRYRELQLIGRVPGGILRP